MLNVYDFPAHLFSFLQFLSLAQYQLQRLSQLEQSPVLLQFPLTDAVIAIDATPTYWALYFQSSSLPLSMSGSWSSSICMVHIALQELQAFAVMLCRMAFQLSGKVVALQLDHRTAKAYLCNLSGTVPLFLSRLACHVSNLANKHGITLNPAYIPIHLNVTANYLLCGKLVPEWHLLPQNAQAAFQIWGQPEVHLLASLCTQAIVTLLHSGKNCYLQ